MTKVALYLWHFTLSVRKSHDDGEEIRKEVEQIAKKYCFQMEDSALEKPENQDFRESDDESVEGDADNEPRESESESESSSSYSSGSETDDDSDSDYSSCSSRSENTDYETDSSEEYEIDYEDEGYIHWQGVISLIKKKTLSQLVQLMRKHDFELQRAHWSPASNNSQGSLMYAVKLDTRVGRTYTDRDEKVPPVPRQIAHLNKDTLYSWQRELMLRSDMPNWIHQSRRINVIIDKKGASGKSSIATYCKCHRFMNAQVIPSILDNFQDLCNCVMSMGKGLLYFADLPRALPKTKLNQFFGFLEQMKSHVYDTRYSYKEYYFPQSPVIWLFINHEVDMSLLSRDRWRIYAINDERELVLYPSMEKDTEEILMPPPIIEEEKKEEEEDEERYSCDEYMDSDTESLLGKQVDTECEASTAWRNLCGTYVNLDGSDNLVIGDEIHTECSTPCGEVVDSSGNTT